MLLVEIDRFQPYKDFYEVTSGFPCRTTVFCNASPACGMIKFSLSLGLEDPEDWVVIEDQLLRRVYQVDEIVTIMIIITFLLR